MPTMPTMPEPTMTIMDRGVTGNSTAYSCAKNCEDRSSIKLLCKIRAHGEEMGMFCLLL